MIYCHNFTDQRRTHVSQFVLAMGRNCCQFSALAYLLLTLLLATCYSPKYSATEQLFRQKWSDLCLQTSSGYDKLLLRVEKLFKKESICVKKPWIASTLHLWWIGVRGSGWVFETKDALGRGYRWDLEGQQEMIKHWGVLSVLPCLKVPSGCPLKPLWFKILSWKFNSKDYSIVIICCD